MELKKEDTKMSKGLAILFMVAIHLFCRKTNLPYSPLIFIKGVPLVYYLGLFGDCAIVIYCFFIGYAHQLSKELKGKKYYVPVLKRIVVFLVDYWLVLCTAAVAGLIVGDANIPGGIGKFLLNFSIIRISYNGAWWFVTIYVIICIISPLVLAFIQKSTVVSSILFFALYFVAHLMRFGRITVPSFSVDILNSLLSTLLLIGSSLLPYATGAIFYKHKLFTKISTQFEKFGSVTGNLILIAVFASAFAFHCVFESSFAAYFTGMASVLCFNLWKKPQIIRKIFLFFGEHSTHIWLLHMFFYQVLFVDFVFIAKYPLLIFALMLIVTTALSFVYNQIMKLLKSTVLSRVC